MRGPEHAVEAVDESVNACDVGIPCWVKSGLALTRPERSAQAPGTS